MALNCTTREVGDVTILELSGLLSLGAPLASGPESGIVLGEKVHDLIQAGRKKILLHLAGVRYVDSSGAGQLAGAYTSACNHGGNLKIVKPSNQVRNLLKMTRLDTLIDVREDEASAIESFNKGAAATS